MSGPLSGYKVLEVAGIGPGPFAAMLLADMGAEIIRIDRAQSVRGGDPSNPPPDPLARGRKSIGVDLKSPDGVETVLKLVEGADALIEGFRPGVTERLGIGPDACLARNERKPAATVKRVVDQPAQASSLGVPLHESREWCSHSTRPWPS